MGNKTRDCFEQKTSENRPCEILETNYGFEYGILVLDKLGITQQYQVDRIHGDSAGWGTLLITISPDYYVHYYPHNDTYYLFHENFVDSFTSWGELLQFIDCKTISESDIGFVEKAECSVSWKK